jgi:hypothetical protein
MKRAIFAAAGLAFAQLAASATIAWANTGEGGRLLITDQVSEKCSDLMRLAELHPRHGEVRYGCWNPVGNGRLAILWDNKVIVVYEIDDFKEPNDV